MTTQPASNTWAGLRCVVFDFAATLSSAPYFAELLPEWAPAIDRLFREESEAWAAPWMAGRVFDVIVNSADEGELRKDVLFETAFARLGGCSFADSLLIDDGAGNVEAFRRRGGLAYRYTEDRELWHWLKGAGLW